MKIKSGRLKAQIDLRSLAEDPAYTILPVSLGDIEIATGLPPHHGDPFDRLLVGQAIGRNLTLVTSDRILGQYDVPLLAA